MLQNALIYTYFNPQSLEQICQVRRAPDKKITQWTLKDDKWIPKGLPPGIPKPLYNALELIKKADASILLVEGEKTCEAAQKLFPNMACMTWLGGAGTAAKADLQLLENKIVYLWPDCDDQGNKAMNIIAQRLLREGAAQVLMVDLNGLNLPEKWDLADENPLQSLSLQDLLDQAKEVMLVAEHTKSVNSKSNPGLFPDLSNDEKRKPLNTDKNIEVILSTLNLDLRLNIMSHSLESIEDLQSLDSTIISQCSRYSVPIRSLAHHLRKISRKNSFHPVVEWIESKPWDGVNRFEEFQNTVKTDFVLWPVLLEKWMLAAVASLYEEEFEGMPGVPVFQGAQGAGKTQWFKRLCPRKFRKPNVTLKLSEKDSRIESLTRWLVDLGEISGTYKKTDVNELKAFILNEEDEFRMPYDPRAQIYPRRTAFIGSVNEGYFLADDTGNRRWWVIPVTLCNWRHKINMQQMWAEIHHLYNSVKSKEDKEWYLSPEHANYINQCNAQFQIIDPILESIHSNFDFSSPNYQWMTATEVAKTIGLQNPTRSEATRVGTILSQLKIDKKLLHGISKYHLPRRLYVK